MLWGDYTSATPPDSARADIEHFVAALVHDLRQPLCAVKGNVEIVRDYYGDRLPAPAAEFLEAAIRMSARMESMVDGLSAYALTGRAQLEAAPVDLNEVLADARASLRVAIENRAPRSPEDGCRRLSAIASS